MAGGIDSAAIHFPKGGGIETRARPGPRSDPLEASFRRDGRQAERRAQRALARQPSRAEAMAPYGGFGRLKFPPWFPPPTHEKGRP